uniref:Viral A-type inclusion protein n=1 Tax=Strongyloides stercoralis TaxID=6248 RepID=A0A0K0ECM2_STRER
MNYSEVKHAQHQHSDIVDKFRKAKIEFNTQCHRYKLEIEELKITISKLKDLNDKAHKRIYKLEQENDELNVVILNLEEKLSHNNMTINNLIIKNNEIKEMNKDYKKQLYEEKEKCTKLSIKPFEENLINEQNKKYENEIKEVINCKDYLKQELDILTEKFSSLKKERLQSKEEISILTDEINKLIEREDTLKMEIDLLKSQLLKQNKKPLIERINDDPELKKYLATKQMMLEHLETENDSMHEMYQLMFRKIKNQLEEKKCSNNGKIYDNNIYNMKKEQNNVFYNKICNKDTPLPNIFLTSYKNCSGKIEIV